MANDLNQVTLTGRLGADPEVRTAGSSKVANLRIAVGEQWKDKNGERQERTEWASITIWGDGLVGVVERFLKKGSRVLVQGKMQTRKWQDKDGNDRYTTEVVIQGFGGQLIMLDGKQDGGSSGQSVGSRPDSYSSGQSSFADDDMSDVPF